MLRKFIFLVACIISVGTISAQKGTNGTSMTFKSLGLKFGSCSSDQMYFSKKPFVNVFDPHSSGTYGVDQVYADKFNYWGTVFMLEQFSKNGYLMFNAAGLLDYGIGSLCEIGQKQFRFGKLKNYSTNFPPGVDKRNLGGVYTDVFEMRLAGGAPIGEHIYWKIGGQYAYGAQASVADFEVPTGATYENCPGYRHTYGGGAHLIYHSSSGAKFVWRNSFFYNWHHGKYASMKLPGNGIKFESMVYTGIGMNLSFYFQSTTMKSIVAEPWLYGEGTIFLPKSHYTNLGFTVSFSLPTRNPNF